jgi:hypothetical protein
MNVKNHAQRHAMSKAIGAETLHTQICTAGLLCGASIQQMDGLATEAVSVHGPEPVQSVDDLALIFNELLEGAE